MGWRARWDTSSPDVGPGCFTNCAKESWRHYINDSAVTAVIISTDENATAIACAAHALGKRAFTVHGMSFGELALQSDEPRAATIHTTEDTELLVTTRRDYERCAGSMHREFIEKRVEFLRSCPRVHQALKQGTISSHDIAAMANLLTEAYLTGHTLACRQGDLQRNWSLADAPFPPPLPEPPKPT